MELAPQASQLRVSSVAQIATGVGILAFWALFYTVGMAPLNPPPCYFAFEHSFLLPDTILAIALIASGVNVRNGGSWGRGVSLVCAGGLLFLGVIDFSFNAQNGGYGGSLIDAVQAAGISVWCVAVGIWIYTIHGRDLHTPLLTER